MRTEERWQNTAKEKKSKRKKKSPRMGERGSLRNPTFLSFKGTQAGSSITKNIRTV